MELGEKIKLQRQKRKISQKELAEHLLVSRQTISNWENEKNNPDMENLILLSDFFCIDITYFINESTEEIYNRKKEYKLVTLSTLSIIFLAILTLISVFLATTYHGPWQIIPFITLNIIFFLIIILKLRSSPKKSYIKPVSKKRLLYIAILSAIVSFILCYAMLNFLH